MTEVKFGALCWNQYTDWPSLLEAGIRADRLGYADLWTWTTSTRSRPHDLRGLADDHRLARRWSGPG